MYKKCQSFSLFLLCHPLVIWTWRYLYTMSKKMHSQSPSHQASSDEWQTATAWRSEQTLRTLRPRRGRPHAAWIITPPESRPLQPFWFMVSGKPNHPMEASHPAQTEAHPSRFVKPSYPTVLYILLICVGLFSFNLAPWFNRNIKGRTQYRTVKYSRPARQTKLKHQQIAQLRLKLCHACCPLE